MSVRHSCAVLLAVLLIPVMPAAAANHTVVATSGNVFEPADVTVTQGDSVTWNNGGGLHNVRFDDGSFDMPADPDPAAWSVSHTFNTVGIVRYYCEAHGAQGGIGMSGAVTVRAPTSTTPPPPPPQQVFADKTAPALILSGAARQKVLRQRAIFLRVEVNEASRVVARARVSIPRTGKLVRTKRTSTQLAARASSSLQLKLSRHALRVFRRALRKRSRLTARVTVTARDAAGNTTSAKRKIRLKK